jgi:hypothetical protein
MAVIGFSTTYFLTGARPKVPRAIAALPQLGKTG